MPVVLPDVIVRELGVKVSPVPPDPREIVVPPASAAVFRVTVKFVDATPTSPDAGPEIVAVLGLAGGA